MRMDVKGLCTTRGVYQGVRSLKIKNFVPIRAHAYLSQNRGLGHSMTQSWFAQSLSAKASVTGSVLIVVLLLLVIMTFMSFALVRSSDVNTLISGNIATKQAAVQAGDVGFREAETLLLGIYSGTAQIPPYYASTANQFITDKAFNKITWSPMKSVVSGLSYEYYIEKINQNPLYRITVRVTGPKHSESYFQTLYGIQN